MWGLLLYVPMCASKRMHSAFSATDRMNTSVDRAKEFRVPITYSGLFVSGKPLLAY